MHSAQIRHASHGLTLIELLVVLACIALLTHLALPTYTQWQMRSQRSQARLALMQAAQWLERNASANGRYPLASDVPANVWQIKGLSYTIQATLNEQSFTLQAVPTGTQSNDVCGQLTLNHLGVQGVAQAQWSAPECWQR